MRSMRFVVLGVIIGMGIPSTGPLQAMQVPLAPVGSSGRTVTPVFEGWYENSDGTYSIYFGYYNRNAEEVLEIPIGPENMMEPAHFDGWQPTQFQPRRHWGVFAVKVPADFGDQQLVWTLKNGGQTFSIPGHLRVEWEIDALGGGRRARGTLRPSSSSRWPDPRDAAHWGSPPRRSGHLSVSR